MFQRLMSVGVLAMMGCGTGVVDLPDERPTTFEIEVGSILSDGSTDLTTIPTECLALYTALEDECEDFSTEEGGSPLIGSHKHMCMAKASAVAANVNAIAAEFSDAESIDLATACDYLDPSWVPTIGNEPTVHITDSPLCVNADSADAPFDCYSGPFSENMTEATQALLHEIDSPEVQWVTLDFTGDTDPAVPWQQSNLMWFAIMKSLHLSQGAPVVVAFENDQGVGSASILQVEFQVDGPTADIDTFMAALATTDVPGADVALAMENLDFVLPTRVVYRQGGAHREWFAAAPTGTTNEMPFVVKTNVGGGVAVAYTGSHPWRFHDVTAIVDPTRVSAVIPATEGAPKYEANGGIDVIEGMYLIMKKAKTENRAGMRPTWGSPF